MFSCPLSLSNSLYRAAHFVNFERILGFSVPSIIGVDAGLRKSQHNTLTNFARLRDERGNLSKENPKKLQIRRSSSTSLDFMLKDFLSRLESA